MRRIIDDSGAHAQVESVIRELVDLALAALDRRRRRRGSPRRAARPGLRRDQTGSSERSTSSCASTRVSPDAVDARHVAGPRRAAAPRTARRARR